MEGSRWDTVDPRLDQRKSYSFCLGQLGALTVGEVSCCERSLSTVEPHYTVRNSELAAWRSCMKRQQCLATHVRHQISEQKKSSGTSIPVGPSDHSTSSCPLNANTGKTPSQKHLAEQSQLTEPGMTAINLGLKPLSSRVVCYAAIGTHDLFIFS